MKSCIFCQISKKAISSHVRYESENIIAFDDINPIAPVHILIISKEHIDSVNMLKKQHEQLVAELIFSAKHIAHEQGIAETGYKLIIRTGKDGGQEIPHIHVHLIGGQSL